MKSVESLADLLRVLGDPTRLRLLAALNITIDASQGQLTDGMKSLLGNTSGNAQIDAPFIELAYEVVAQRAAQAPR